jgi:environmental stress-induced protein Ves
VMPCKPARQTESARDPAPASKRIRYERKSTSGVAASSNFSKFEPVARYKNSMHPLDSEEVRKALSHPSPFAFGWSSLRIRSW